MNSIRIFLGDITVALTLDAVFEAAVIVAFLIALGVLL
jgi:hypothetical protein